MSAAWRDVQIFLQNIGWRDVLDVGIVAETGVGVVVVERNFFDFG